MTETLNLGQRYIIQGTGTGGPEGLSETHAEVCSEEDADMHIEGTPLKIIGPEQLLVEKELKESTHATVVIEGTENNRAARREAAAKARKKHPPKKPEAGKTNKWDRENRHTRLNPSSK